MKSPMFPQLCAAQKYQTEREQPRPGAIFQPLEKFSAPNVALIHTQFWFDFIKRQLRRPVGRVIAPHDVVSRWLRDTERGEIPRNRGTRGVELPGPPRLLPRAAKAPRSSALALATDASCNGFRHAAGLTPQRAHAAAIA